MNKLQVLRVVNGALLVSFIAQALTSMVIFFRMKVPYRAAISEIHEYNGVTLIVLVIAHIVLNWGWIRANLFPRK